MLGLGHDRRSGRQGEALAEAGVAVATKREGESALPAAPAAPFFFSLAARPAGRPATQSPGTRRCREQGRAGPRSGEGDRDPWPPTPVTPERRGETHLGESNCSSGHDKCRPRSLVFLTLSLPRPPRRLSLPQPFARHSCPARSVCEQRPDFLVSSPHRARAARAPGPLATRKQENQAAAADAGPPFLTPCPPSTSCTSPPTGTPCWRRTAWTPLAGRPWTASRRA